MDSTAKLRPNHYQLLGLTPDAKPEQIAQAFTRQLSEPRPFGSLAEVTIAYETLRDPAKRRAYDSSHGLEPKPKPAFSLAGRLEGTQFGDAKPTSLMDRLDSARALRASAVPKALPRPQSRSAPSATALLRQPITPIRREGDPIAEPKPKEFPRPVSAEKQRPEPEARDTFSRILSEGVHDTSPPSVNWALPAAAAGALVLAVGIGAWTGWEAGNDGESVTVKVPSPKSHPRIIEPLATEAAAVVPAASPQVKMPAPAPTARRHEGRPPLQITLPEKQAAEVAMLEQRQHELEIEQAAAVESPAVAAAAKMPLPNAVIARTIARIGYPCGQVASTAAVEGGAPGVFNVTCTSGHSYRASPVRGRYHFRRLASR